GPRGTSVARDALQYASNAPADVDTRRIKVYTRVSASWDVQAAGALPDQRGGPHAGHASADAPEVRAARPRPSAPDAGEHACVHARGTGAPPPDQAPRRRDGHQPGGRPAVAVRGRGRPADAASRRRRRAVARRCATAARPRIRRADASAGVVAPWSSGTTT